MKTPQLRSIGPVLRDRRLEMNMSQIELARALGYYTAQFVSMWERGVASVPAPKIPAIAIVLGFDLRWLTNELIKELRNSFKKEVDSCIPTKEEKAKLLKARTLALSRSAPPAPRKATRRRARKTR